MATKIEKTTIIGDVLDIAPQTAPLFMASAARHPAARPSRKPAWSTAWTPTPSLRRSTASSRPARKTSKQPKRRGARLSFVLQEIL